MLCSHSNKTCAPIANSPNSAQIGGTPTIPPSYIRVRAVMWACGWRWTDRHTDKHTVACRKDDKNNLCVLTGCRSDVGNSQCRFFALRPRTSAQTFACLISAAAVVHIFPLTVYRSLTSFAEFSILILQSLFPACDMAEVLYAVFWWGTDVQLYIGCFILTQYHRIHLDKFCVSKSGCSRNQISLINKHVVPCVASAVEWTTVCDSFIHSFTEFVLTILNSCCIFFIVKLQLLAQYLLCTMLHQSSDRFLPALC